MVGEGTQSLLLDDIAAPLLPLLRDDVTDLCINGPGVVWIETGGQWERLEAEALSGDWIGAFGRAVASWMSASLNERSPILSGHLPSGERIQFILPPAAEQPSVTIRRPSRVSLGLDDLARLGAFEPIARRDEEQAHHRATVRSHFADVRLGDSGAVAAFLREIVEHRLNVIISGATGSGKTTLSKAMIAEVPAHERLITIEDAKELEFPHANAVRLFFSRDGAGVSPATVKDLLVSCLRMRPDRIMLAELRDEEAYYYLRNVNTGHPGSITTVHANSAAAAVEQLMLMVLQSPAGAGLGRGNIRRLVHNLVDVIIQMDKKKVTEILILPEADEC